MQDNGAGALHLDKRDYRFFYKRCRCAAPKPGRIS